MAATKYIVCFNPNMAVGSRNGVKSAIVVAESSADAIDALQARFGGDSDAAWEGATATAIAAGSNWLGWTLRCEIVKPDGTVLVDVSVVGAGSDDSFDEIAALMVIALNATAALANAAYNSSTQVLSVAGAGDGKGDHELNVWFYPAGERVVSLPGAFGSIVDGGSAGSALTFTFAADAYAVPAITGTFRDPV